MSTEKRDRDEVYTATDGTAQVAAQQAAEQTQLSFFDAEIPVTMNTTTSDASADEPEQTLTEQLVVMPPSAADAAAESSPSAPVVPTCAVTDECLGQRLRAVREARGMSCEEAALRLKLPLTIVQALEAERYDRIGHGIYLRGYLAKYLQLLDLPQVLAERVVNEHVELPLLVTSGTISRPRYLFNRYSVSALYLILTGVIIVPAVLLAMRTGFDQNLAGIAPLDIPEAVAPATMDAGNDNVAPTTSAATESATAIPAQSAPAQVAPPVADETPLIASMAPFPAIKPAAGGDTSNSDKPAVAIGAHNLRLSLTEPSWVEIVASDGHKLEYGLLPAGSVRNYSSDKALDVRLGNCIGASVELDGKTQDIAPYRHSNVAHFKLASGETAISHSGG